MQLNSLTAISPVDGRYRKQVEKLGTYFSEFALIKYRIHVEIEYFIALCNLPLPQLQDFDKDFFTQLRGIVSSFDEKSAQRVKDIEKTTNHDVKAVEYFIKEKFEDFGLGAYKEFIHFGLTSQDINNTAVPLQVRDFTQEMLIPLLNEALAKLKGLAETWEKVPMLARTHGQPASPTRLGKELLVFVERIERQKQYFESIPYSGKFGGATGNMNAHYITYPEYDWHGFAENFVSHLGLSRSFPTTQIEHYDNFAAYCDNQKRINTIIIDLCRDVWQYISMNYFKQKSKAGEIGSSAMPHKVNPIDFENAEGNLGIANALFEHFSTKLPISRLQRDLTDSTVLRNVGVPLAHTVIALNSLKKGLDKIELNEAAINEDLNNNWAVVAEALQTILRRENYPNPYEALLTLTRNKAIDESAIKNFIMSLNVSEQLKKELLAITPFTYTGK